MSLKGFHLVFITLAALICVGFCVWAFVWVQESNVTAFLKICGASSGVLGAGLSVYGVWFAKKNRRTNQPSS